MQKQNIKGVLEGTIFQSKEIDDLYLGDKGNDVYLISKKCRP